MAVEKSSESELDRTQNKCVGKKTSRGEGEERTMQQIKERKINKYAHWKRRDSSLLLTVLEGEPSGTNRVGRRKKAWFDNICEWSDRSGSEVREAARERRLRSQ